MFSNPLFLSLFAVAFVWIGANTIAFHSRGKRLATPTLAVGKSMEPAISGGLTASFDVYPHNVEEGDIVTYRRGGVNISHRVVKVDGERVLIKGDNNDFSDGWHHKEDIVSKAWAPTGEPLWIPLSPYSIRYKIRTWRNS